MLKKVKAGQWICLAMTALLLALAVGVYYGDALSYAEKESLIQSHKQGVGQLTEEPLVKQAFIAPADGLCGVEVMASNYNKKLRNGTLTLWLTDAEGHELARQDYPVEGMKNNAFVTLDMPAVQDSAGRQYMLYATSDCTEEKGVTVRMGPSDGTVGELVLADGTVTVENALNLRICYEVKQYNTMGGGIMLLAALCFAACIPLAGGKERRHA